MVHPQVLISNFLYIMNFFIIPDFSIRTTEDASLAQIEHHIQNYIITSWCHSNSIPIISRMELYHLHRALKHSELSSVSKLLRQSLADQPPPLDLKRELDRFRCLECVQTPELPRKPKFPLPADVTANFVVSLDVMLQITRTKPTDILVIIDNCDMLLRLAMLHDRATMTAFSALYRKLVSIFDSPTYVVVDRESNLASVLMKDELHEIEA